MMSRHGSSGLLLLMLFPLLAYAGEMTPTGKWSGLHRPDSATEDSFTAKLELQQREGRVTGSGEFEKFPTPPPGTPPGGVYLYTPWRMSVQLEGSYLSGQSGGFTFRRVELLGRGPVTIRYKLELGANDCCLEGTVVADADYGPFKAGQPVTIRVTRDRP
ncbi:MAG: hypothetical protein ACT4PE_06160 [Candidatus Eiseniibacteriota bacterium]